MLIFAALLFFCTPLETANAQVHYYDADSDGDMDAVWYLDQNGTITINLVRCDNDEYVFHAVDTYELDDEIFEYNDIVYFEDIDADGYAEVVTAPGGCGAHTCYHTMRVISWAEDGFIFRGSSPVSLPYPEFEITTDGFIIMRGTGIGSAGAGVYRQEVVIFNGETFQYSLTPPVYILHALHDADLAVYMGEYTTALELYTDIINDEFEPMPDSPDYYEISMKHYAQYRIVITYALMDDMVSAYQAYIRMYDDLIQNPGVPNTAQYIELVDLYFDYGCKAVQAYIEQDLIDHPTTSIFTYFNQFGYANQLYTPESFCPSG